MISTEMVWKEKPEKLELNWMARPLIKCNHAEGNILKRKATSRLIQLLKMKRHDIESF